MDDEADVVVICSCADVVPEPSSVAAHAWAVSWILAMIRKLSGMWPVVRRKDSCRSVLLMMAVDECSRCMTGKVGSG